MSITYTKEQCLQWIKNPTVNPQSGLGIGIGKIVFNKLLKSCQTQVSIEEVQTINPEMTKFLFPTQLNNTSLKLPLPLQKEVPLPLQTTINNGDGDICDEIESLEKIVADVGILDPLSDTSFPIPTKVEFKISKLTDKNKKFLEKNNAKNLMNEDQILSLVATDDFIIKLIESEKKLLIYKKIAYKKIMDQIKNTLSDPLLTAEIEKPANPSEGPKESLATVLQKKLTALNSNLTLIDKRINSLSQPLTAGLIDDKRKKIMNIIDDQKNGTRTLIGEAREEIRKTIYTKIATFAKAPELYINRFNNLTIMGGAGTGKTKLAGVIANLFYNLGILNTQTVITVTRSDLVGAHIGQTAPLTRKYLDSTLEGVLFIDEAYQLSGCPDKQGNFMSKDYGAESITEIVNYIDKNIGLSVIIAAGYEDKMTDCFFKINEGMKRRFPNNIRLIDYTSEDLSKILHYNIEKIFDKQLLTESQIQYINRLISKLNDYETPKLFKNQAGDMLNLSVTLVQDLVLGQKKGYKAVNINDTFTKFFINKGFQVTIK
jgi:hypothetical protein